MSRKKFKKRDNSVLQKTYDEREERSKMGGGKSVFNEEKMKEFNLTEFRPTLGENYIEILPISTDSMIPYFVELPIHYGVGFANDSFVCTQRFKRTPCFRCEKQAKLYKEHPKNTKPTDEIKALYPTDRAVYVIWDRTEEFKTGKDTDPKLQIWAAPKSKIHAEVQMKARDKKTKQLIDISDLDSGKDGGRTVSFDYVKEQNKDFPDYKAIDLIERDDDFPDELIEMLEELVDESEGNDFTTPIDMLLNIPEYDDVKEAMLTEEDDEENDDKEEEEEEKPRKSRFAKSSKKANKEEDDEEEDEEEEDEEDDEEEEEKPRKSKLKKPLRKNKKENVKDKPKKKKIDLEELEEELSEMSNLKFKRWCKDNDFEDLIGEDREDAIEEILNKMDDIPY